MNEEGMKKAEIPVKSGVLAFFICAGAEQFCPLLSPFCPLAFI